MQRNPSYSFRKRKKNETVETADNSDLKNFSKMYL